MGLVQGNSKLGGIWHWSIPAIDTCPGKTELCSSLCYAARGHYYSPSVIQALEANERQSRLDRFADYVLGMIQKHRIRRMRIHAAGDFYDAEYANKWLDIFNQSRLTTQYWLYTRSWRIPAGLAAKDLRQAQALRKMVHSMTLMPNVRVWLSADRQTGRPPRWKRSRVAYLMQDDNDRPRYRADIIFREQTKTELKVEPSTGTLVCPVEQGVERAVKITCESCRLCFRWGQLDQLNARQQLVELV